MFKKFQELQEVSGYIEDNMPIKGYVKTIDNVKRVILENGEYVDLNSIKNLKQIGRILNEELDAKMAKAVSDFSSYYDNIFDKEKVSKASDAVINKIIKQYADQSKDNFVKSNKDAFTTEAKSHINSLNSEEAIKSGSTTVDKEIENLKKDSTEEKDSFEERLFSQVDAGQFSFKEGYLGKNWYNSEWDVKRDLKRHIINESKARAICENNGWDIEWLDDFSPESDDYEDSVEGSYQDEENDSDDILEDPDYDSIDFEEDDCQDCVDEILDMVSYGSDKDDVVEFLVTKYGMSFDEADEKYEEIMSDFMFDDFSSENEVDEYDNFKEFEDKLDSFDDRFYDDLEILESFINSYNIDREDLKGCSSLEESILKIAEISSKNKKKI